MLSATFSAGGQEVPLSGNHNYTLHRKMLDDRQLTSFNEIQYYNGLGFPTIAATSVGGNGDIVYTITTYDGQLREKAKYLPVPMGNSMLYKNPDEVVNTSAVFHQGDGTAYYTNNYDALDRIVAVDMPGKDWRDNQKSERVEYSSNNPNEVLHYETPLDKITLIKPENASYKFYPAGSLTKKTTIDADGRRVAIFVDISGNKILERREQGDTYFVYNALGQLRFVLTPKYQQYGNKDLFAYEYRYDQRGRVVKKLLPGCKYVQYWYDRNDRVIFYQDENLRAKSKYRYWLYDVLGRLAVQGLCDGCKRDDSKLPVVTYSTESRGLLDTGYLLNMGDLLKNPTIEKVNYYDNYNFLNGSMKDTFANMTVHTSLCANGFLTGSISKASNGEYIYSTYSYDLNGNITETKTKGLKGLLEHTHNIYTFTNNLEKSSSVVYVGYGQPFVTATDYTFNKHNDKPETCVTTVLHGEGQQTSSISYTYDDFGQLKSVSRPFGSGQSGTVNYKYDLHGWTKQITTNSFKESMFYADGPGTPCYNGNISSLTWENAGYKQKRGYRLTYDRLNRMANAAYGERDDLSDNAGHYDETLEYDINGNITRLQRNGLKQDGQYGKIDNLHLSYSGNQPVVIKEDAEPILYEGAFGLNEKGEHRLAYNGSGALQSDETRGIAMIVYDDTNNPRQIQFTNGNVTEYVYTPSGQKLRTIHYTAVPNIKVEIGQVHSLTADEILYSDSIDYMMGGKLITKNGRIDKYLFEGGYCQAIGSQTLLPRPPFPVGDDETVDPSAYEQWRKTFESWEAAMKAERERDQFLFYYYNRDHLGNIREVADDNGNVVQVNNYYPFGSPYCDTSASKAPELQPCKYNGKELDLMHGLNTYDYGARQYNPVVPIWDRVDPLCEKYYNTSPYAYCGNNPVNAVDPEGKDSYLLIWFAQKKNVGHAGFAIANYNYKGQMNGTYTYLDLWPLEGHKLKGDTNNAAFQVKSNIELIELLHSDVTGYENRKPDAYIKIFSNREKDTEAYEAMKEEINNDKYDLFERNCSDFAKTGIQAATGIKVDGQEQILTKKVTTPGQLFRDVRKIKGVQTVIQNKNSNTEQKMSTYILNQILNAFSFFRIQNSNWHYSDNY